jgi:serine/threonine-protein kinase
VRTLGRRYRLEVPLGSGGMAEVWRARDLVLGREVAVKLLTASFGDRAAGAARARIRAEAQVAAGLAHPNIASVYDFGESRQIPRRGRAPYIVMELVHGDTLAVRQQGDPMHWRTAVGIAAQVAAALAAAHASGVVHRDIKPGNVMLARSGVKVVDFGIAAAVGALDEAGDELLGTPAYVAPERFAGRPAAPATDVYALGILLYQCLAGSLPWPAYTITELVRAHRELPPDPLPPIDGLPADVIELCEQCLRKNPDARPASLYAAVVLAEAAGIPVTLPAVVPVDAAPAAAVPATAEPAAAVRAAADAAAAGGADVATGAMADPARVPTWEPGRPGLAGRPRLPGRPGSPGRRRVRSHASVKGRRRASERSLAGAAGTSRRGVRRRLIAAGVAGLAGLVGLLAASTAHLLSTRTAGPAGNAATPGGGCAAQYVANPGAGGAFTAEVAITNTGGARLDQWSLEFALPGGQRITDARGVRWIQRGEAVTLRGAAPLEAGGTQRLSLTGTSTSTPVAPTRFTLDGASCTPGAGAVAPATR